MRSDYKWDLKAVDRERARAPLAVALMGEVQEALKHCDESARGALDGFVVSLEYAIRVGRDIDAESAEGVRALLADLAAAERTPA